MVAAQGLSTQLQVRAGLNRPGDVITFYSYKGGTGRSMGLVNCAGLIAQQLPADAKPILLIDFDLEAPGLHRYLQPFMTNEDMESRQGVLELFEALAAEVTRCLAEEPLETDSASNEPDSTEDSRRLDDEKTQTLVDAFDLAPFIVSTQIKGLHLIVSGRFDSTYDQRLTRFDWEALYAKAPALFRCLGARFAREYSYTFVDSRTGLSDTSGICTMLLPSVLVVVFTPNSQSLTGIEHLVRRAMSYRESGADSRELRIYPLPSRVDNQVEHFRQVWRMGDPHHSLFGTVTGYQPLFERVFETMIASGGLDASAQLGEYFDAVQIPHTADYAYGERLCFVSAASADNLSIRNSFEQFLPWIATGAQPWERPAEVTLNQQATHWLRDSGADHEPAEESGWHAWYERLAQVLRTPEHPVIHQYASLAPDTRVDTSIVLALAYAYQGDGAAATEWIRRAVNAYDDNVAVSLCTTAPLQLLRLWTDALAADEFTPELEAWVPEVDAWMLRWQPLKTERRMWLLELVELARKRRLYEFLWRAQAELEGGASDAALQSMAIFVDVLCDRGDFERARHLQMQLVETCSQAFGDDDPATIEARLKLDAIGVKRVSVGGATPRALRDCRYSAYISYAVYDDMAWNHWVTGFASVLDKTLWSRLRGHTPLPIHLAGSDADNHGLLEASLRERLAASFCLVIVVHDNYVFSQFCMQELAVFCELYGEQGLRERLFVVAISRSAIEQLYRNPDWQRITRREELVWLPFYKEDNPDVPVEQYSDAGRDIFTNAFWTAFVRLREHMADLMRRSLHEREHESLSSFSNLRGPDEKPLESVSIYIESNQRERVLWKALGELLVKRWDLAVSALAPNRSLRLRTRGLPMDDLDQYPALADADGIVLLWGLKTADTLLAQINNVESKLPGNDLVPGIVAYLMPPQMNPNRPLPAWGWEVLRFNTESDQQIDVVHEELEDLDRFLGDVLRRKLSVFTSQGVATRALM